MGTIVLKDLLNEQRFSFKRHQEKKEKNLIINECIYIVVERDFASGIDFRKISRDPKYFAKKLLRSSFLVYRTKYFEDAIFQGFIF